MRPTLLVLLCLFLALPARAGLEGKKDELEALRGRIEQLKKEIEQASEDRAEVADALKQSERSISDVNRRLRGLDAQRRALQRELEVLQASSGEARLELQRQQEQLAGLVRARYVQGGEDSLKLILGGQDPAEVARKLEYLRYVGVARNQLIRDYRASLGRLQALEARTRTQTESLQTVQREHLSQKQLLEQEKTSRKRVLDDLSKQIHAQRREVGTLARDEQRLARLIQRLSRIATAPKAPQKQGQKPAGKAVPDQAVTRVADASMAGTAFNRLKGRLAFPVAGEVAYRYGQSRPGGGPAWKGLFIRAPQGREVRAVGSGQVAFSDWLRGFGNLLIVDHGEGFLSLYSNNESLYKQAGDRIQAGDVIATVGNTGGQEEPGLYFELRFRGQPFDPLSWVKTK